MPDDSAPAPSYRPPDAILVDRDYPPGVEDIAKHQQRNAIFGPALGCARVQSGHSGAGFTRSFIRPFGADTSLGRYHPQAHPEAGTDRYAWFVARKDGHGKDARWAPVLPLAEGEPEPAGEVLFGYLKPDRHSTEVTAAATRKALDERIAALRDDGEFRARLAELQVEAKAARPVVLPEQSDKVNAPIARADAPAAKKVQKP